MSQPSPRQSASLNPRAQMVLKTVVEHYIREGQPVASKTLVQQAGLPVSPATVRNIMADLETRGLLASPHTSAGRVPTAQGYRLFVDALLHVQPLRPHTLQRLRLELDPDRPTQDLLASASRLLSDITQQTGLVTLPRREEERLRQIEFLPLTGNRVLVILVVNERDVQNRIIHLDRHYDEAELARAAQRINEQFAGHSLADIQHQLIHALQADKDRLDAMMQTTIDVASQALTPEAPRPDYVVAGENRLLEGAGPGDIDRLRELFEAFNRKRDLLHLMDRCLRADGVQIFIGEETGQRALEGYSLITAPYHADGGNVVGVLGVIGPSRMAYQRVIPMVDATAKLLSAALRGV